VDRIWGITQQNCGSCTYLKEISTVRDNSEKQLSLMRDNWGGTGTIPVQCPSWAILSLDHIGRTRQLCCISSPDTKVLKPICEDL
jgi:hypothetical protein